MKTRVTMDFVVDHEGDKMLGSFNVLDFLEAGFDAVPAARRGITTIDPGAKLTLRVHNPRKTKKR